MREPPHLRTAVCRLLSLDLLADVGANFIRGSHYPQDPRWLAVTDRRGVYVWSENFYGWPFPDAPSPPSTTVTTNAGAVGAGDGGSALPAPTDPVAWMRASLTSLDEMIDAGFNSPSILIWAFFSEAHSHTHPLAQLTHVDCDFSSLSLQKTLISDLCGGRRRSR